MDASERHRAAFQAVEAARVARTAAADAAPTLDTEVRLTLRARGEPATVFGEGLVERRDRLRLLIARALVDTGGIAAAEQKAGAGSKSGGAAEEQTFFTEGCPELAEARQFLAKTSIPAAFSRLARFKTAHEAEDPIAREMRLQSFCNELQPKIHKHLSQVGDVRPLLAGKFSPDSKLLAIGSSSSAVKIFSSPEGAHLDSVTGHTERVHGVDWNPSMASESQMLATCGADSCVKLWKVAVSAKDSVSDERSAALPMHNCLRTLSGHEQRVNKVQFHPTGKYISSTSHDETWRMWNLETGQQLLLQEGHSRPVYALCHHPDGSLLATGDTGGIVRVWDLRTGRTVMVLAEHVKAILALAVNPASPHLLASGSADRIVKMWDMRKMDCFENILAHSHLIATVCFEPVHGRYLLTGSYDKSLRLWSSEEWRCFKVLSGHESFVTAADISPDGSTILSASHDRTFKLWRIDSKS